MIDCLYIYCINIASFCGSLPFNYLPGVESVGVQSAWISAFSCSWPWLGAVHLSLDPLGLSSLTAAISPRHNCPRLQLNFAAVVRTRARVKTSSSLSM